MQALKFFYLDDEEEFDDNDINDVCEKEYEELDTIYDDESQEIDDLLEDSNSEPNLTMNTLNLHTKEPWLDETERKECIYQVQEGSGNFFRQEEKDIPANNLKLKTGKKNVLIAVPIFRAKLLDDEGIAIKRVPYLWKYDNKKPIHGTTDDDGVVVLPLPTSGKSGELHLIDENQEVNEIFRIQHFQKEDDSEVYEIQASLNNFGIPCGKTDGNLGIVTATALIQFQAVNGLDQTGEIDSETKNRLKEYQ